MDVHARVGRRCDTLVTGIFFYVRLDAATIVSLFFHYFFFDLGSKHFPLFHLEQFPRRKGGGIVTRPAPAVALLVYGFVLRLATYVCVYFAGRLKSAEPCGFCLHPRPAHVPCPRGNMQRIRRQQSGIILFETQPGPSKIPIVSCFRMTAMAIINN